MKAQTHISGGVLLRAIPRPIRLLVDGVPTHVAAVRRHGCPAQIAPGCVQLTLGADSHRAVTVPEVWFDTGTPNDALIVSGTRLEWRWG